jgi:glycerol kinase
MAFVLALDQGTSSSRSIVFDEEGEIRASARSPFPQLYPRPGRVEHDPEAIWESQKATMIEALRRASLSFRDIAAIGITNQRETVVVWDRRTGTPLHNAIVWQDRRTSSHTEKLAAKGHEAMVRERTGLVLDPYFAATKIGWILDAVPHARERAARGELAAGTIDSWLLYRLTDGAVHATDCTNAARTLLFDITTFAWEPALLELFGIPASLLPDVKASCGHFGDTAPSLTATAVPITGVAGDQHAALFGQVCIDRGMAKNTYGTGSFLLANTGATPVITPGRLLGTVAWQFEGHPPVYALEGSIFTTGAAIQWLRDGLKVIGAASEVDALARSVPDSGGVCVVPAFAGLGAPHWDPRARGAVLGVTRGTSAAHIARATLEGIALRVAEVFDLMAQATGLPLPALRVDGGASACDLLMQLQADLLGVPVERPAMRETTALGAAYLAALGCGLLDDIGTLAARWRPERTFEPAISADQRETIRQRWARAIERAKGWEEEEGWRM